MHRNNVPCTCMCWKYSLTTFICRLILFFYGFFFENKKPKHNNEKKAEKLCIENMHEKKRNKVQRGRGHSVFACMYVDLHRRHRCWRCNIWDRHISRLLFCQSNQCQGVETCLSRKILPIVNGLRSIKCYNFYEWKLLFCCCCQCQG